MVQDEKALPVPEADIRFKEELLEIFQTAKDVDQDETCARIVGINMEGPFLDPAKKGAHVEGYIRKPDIEFF